MLVDQALSVPLTVFVGKNLEIYVFFPLPKYKQSSHLLMIWLLK